MAINKVGSKGILDCSVAAVDFAPGTVTSVKIADDAVTNAKLSNSSITASGTSIALGASSSLNNAFIDWQSVITSNTTMVAGRGYFVNTTSGAISMTLPSSGTAGDTIAIKDYAGTFGSNNLTILRNSHKIQGVANDSKISTNRASVVLVYVDATKGWLYTNEHNVADLQDLKFISATGGTITTDGNFKVHSFTGDGNFVVSCGGNAAGSNTVNYLVVAGAGGGGAGPNNGYAGGGGAGGFRMASCFSISAQSYPITVGGGGAAGSNGSNSVFATISSAGGGAGGNGGGPEGDDGSPGGSGGGGGSSSTACETGPSGRNNGGTGNTPPVSPPQGNNGGYGQHQPGVSGQQGGGGGASQTGRNGDIPHSGTSGDGGNGSPATPVFGASPKPFYGPTSGVYAGGGGGNGDNPGAGGSGGGGSAPGGTGTANTGGGGANGASGGKGIVLIRYKFQ